MQLGIIIGIGFTIALLLRSRLRQWYIIQADELLQPKRSFVLDFCLCLLAGFLISVFNGAAFQIPLLNMISLLIGCIIAGFFIGLDSALAQERQVILQAIQKNSIAPLPKKFWPMTNRFTLVAITTFLFVSLVLILVFTRDIEWLAMHVEEEGSLQAAQLSVIYEILFIMTVLTVLTVNLIVSYSRNLKLLFDNETKVLEQVSKGDLTAKVPVATHDEFGVIAGHTNHMIDGLRHRFELISSLKLAEEVQQNLLPDHSPFLGGFDISGTSIYCEQTGGDYYDYFLLDNNRLAVVVADACGHGIGAAMLMTSVRAFITSAIKEYRSPAKLMQQINSFITKDCAKTGRFTSLFFVELDHLTKQIRWVRAGHEPPLLFHSAENSFTRLEGAGLVLGVDENFQFEEHVNRLATGDILLIGTDGIHETRNESGELFGLARIKEILIQNQTVPAEDIQKKLVTELQTFRGELAQEDDVTLVLIKVN